MAKLLMTDHRNPRSIGFRLRQRRGRRIMQMIAQISRRQGTCRIIDVGGRPEYWDIFDKACLHQHQVTITLVNSEADQIVLDERHAGLFTAAVGDGCRLEVANDAFDLAHSNSVIEHVGDWARMRDFAREIRRIAPAYYVQTPSYWFPIEPHFAVPFFHWLPESQRATLVARFALGYFPRAPNLDAAMDIVQSARLLGTSQFRTLFPDARLAKERVLGLTKSLLAMRDSRQ